MPVKKPSGGGDVVSIQRTVSLEFIKNSGGWAVQAPRGEKNPGKAWDPKTNSKSRSDQALHDLGSNDLNVGIHLCGNLVDVDVDSDADFLTMALDNFLPSCAHVWGRPSRPKTHRVYQINDDEGFNPSDWSILNRLNGIPEAQIEVRGGPQTRGEYSLLPGSIHPEGEMYEWTDLSRARNSLSVTSVDRIIRGVRFAGALAVLAPYWIEGMRNNLVMALSGFLYKAHEISESLGGDAFSMDKDEAERFLKVLLNLVDTDPGDRHSRLQTFQMTWKKAAGGTAVTGATTIADITGDKTIVGKLYTLLTDSPDIAAIEEFTGRFAIWQGPGLVIDMEQAKNGAHKPIMSRQNFANSFGHKAITVGGKRRLLADLLFHLETTTRVAGLTFMPGQELMVDTREGKKVNQWSGFDMKPHGSPVRDDDVRMFLQYVWEVLANEDKGLNDWILGWLAHIFQEPASKTGTALVLVGRQGAGKSFLGHEIIMKMVGEIHSGATKSVESITRGFNVLFDNKIFVQCDEATNNRQKITQARLKSLITDPWVEIEPKGVDPYFKPNHMRYVFTSNDIEDAIGIDDGADDRRYTVAEVSNRYVHKEVEFWHPFLSWLGDNLPKVMRWLLDYKYDRAFIAWPYVTSAKTTMQQHSWSTFDAWLGAWIARDHPLSDACHLAWYDAPTNDGTGTRVKAIARTGWPDLISVEALTRDYASFCRTYNRHEPLMNEVQLGHALMKRGLRPDPWVRVRVRVDEWDQKKQINVNKIVGVYAPPPRAVVEAYLTRKYNFRPDQFTLDGLVIRDTVSGKSEF